MKFIDDWKRVLRKAWSIRFALAASVLSAVEVVINLLTPDKPTPWFAALAGLACLAAAVSRVVAQQKLHE